MTLVSIVTPSFNQSSFLELTLRSVLEQDYPNVEYSVVDGGSTDGSVDIIRRYADRLHGWVSETDSGQAEAVNKGLARARGDIVAWLNSDDTYLPGAIGAAVRAFQAHPEAVMVYGNMYAVDEEGLRTNLLRYRQLSLQDLLCFQIIGQPAVFLRRSAFDKVGGIDTSFHLLLDHQLWLKIACQGPIVHCEETWAAARYHDAAKNRALAARFGREAQRILDWAAKDENLGPLLAKVSLRARASAHRVDARYMLDAGQPMQALAAWGRALLIHPPTAMARLNLAGSALLELVGLGGVRAAVIRQRQKHLSARLQS
jgi:glycosyltransferase involved in cell wall biosynthesis